MFLKVMWNRDDFPEYTLISCDTVIVNRLVDDNGQSYVHIITEKSSHSVCLKPAKSFAYVLNNDGKTIETIRA